NVADERRQSRLDSQAPVCVSVGILLRKTRTDRFHFSLRLVLRDTRFEARNHAQEVRAALGRDWLLSGSVPCDRGPQLDRIVLNRKFKRRRHHANNRETNAVERDSLVDDGWIAAEALLKKRVTEDHDASRLGRFVFIREKCA